MMLLIGPSHCGVMLRLSCRAFSTSFAAEFTRFVRDIDGSFLPIGVWR